MRRRTSAPGWRFYQYHRYLFQRENPPLPRLVLAIAPYLGGMRYDNRGNFPEQIHSIFYGHGDYRANLVRARVGNICLLRDCSGGAVLHRTRCDR